MHLSGSRFIYSATDVSGHLACAHLTSLNQRKAAGGPEPPYFTDPGTEVLRRRGQEHEQAIVDRFEAEDLEVVRGPECGWDAGRSGWKACAAENSLPHPLLFIDPTLPTLPEADSGRTHTLAGVF